MNFNINKKPRASQGSLYAWIKRFRLPMILALLLAVAVLFLVRRSRSVPADGSVPDVDINASVLNTPDLSAQPSPGDEASPSPVIDEDESYALGDRSERIKEIQIKLMDLGYLSADEPTDYFAAPLEEAVKLFQRANHMTQTGIADNLTLQLLYSPSAANYILEFGNSGNDVQLMQERLSQLGYYDDKNNGYYGIATERAVQGFQFVNGLTINGKTDSETYEIMFSPYALNTDGVIMELEPEPEPTPTAAATVNPTPAPADSQRPTAAPVTARPTSAPTARPSSKPTAAPSAVPTSRPTATPRPTDKPTAQPTPFDFPTPTPTAAATETPTPEPSSTDEIEATATPAPSGSVEAFIDVLYAQLGKPYIFGDSGPDSFDCSGLVYYCLKQVGVNIGRLNAAGFSMYENWDKVDEISDLRRGDLVFFYNNSYSRISHVGVYIGNNQFLHASSSNGSVVISNMGNWFHTYFAWGRRVFD